MCTCMHCNVDAVCMCMHCYVDALALCHVDLRNNIIRGIVTMLFN